ncbi:MAG TPA: monovalent cation/H(+) antiporter subunit G [Vicinamibacterales bacterium]|nr:monovalent cation/H(+) antiporter subunit G [Vicinamibacterales bacterium]
MTVIAGALVLVGSVLLLIAALGLFLLPDALARQHAATKAGTLAISTVLVGTALTSADPSWWWRSAAVILVLFVTLPVASHMLARAAARELFRPEDLARATRVGAGPATTGDPAAATRHEPGDDRG